MECVGARNFSAMAVSFDSHTRVKRKELLRRPLNLLCGYRSCCLHVEARGGSESLVAVDENYADEEDFIKAGGSELLFVQMQQNKSMDKQSKLVDKVLCFD